MPLTSSVMRELYFKKVYQEAMVRSFQLMLASSELWLQYGEGHIVLLFGASSVGKSSLCRELVRMSPDWYSDSNDLAIERRLDTILSDISLFKKILPERYAVLSQHLSDENVLLAVSGKDYAVLPVADTEYAQTIQKIDTMCQRVSMIEQLCTNMSEFAIAEEDLFTSAINRSKHGVSVILDTLDFEHFMQFKTREQFHCPFQAVFVFCPLHTLDQRVMNRNLTALAHEDRDELRLGLFPFLTYSTFVRQSRGQAPSLDSFTNLEALQILETHSEFERAHTPGIAANAVDWMSDVIKAELGLEDGAQKVIDVTEKYPSDYLLDASLYTPIELAHIIKDRNKPRL